MSVLPVWRTFPMVQSTVSTVPSPCHIIIDIIDFDIEAQYEPEPALPLISIFYHSFLYFTTHL